MKNTTIRFAKREDCPQLLTLMRELAVFEGYIGDFKVTVHDLTQRGFPEIGQPEFYALLAEHEQKIHGMLVYYFIPFTYDLRPSLFIKELFVADSVRNLGVGEQLFNAAVEQAKQQHCGRIKWDVWVENHAAKRFYLRQGAKKDEKWQIFSFQL